MKKLFHLTAVVLVLLLLSSCAPSGYKLMQENGSYYIQFSAGDSSTEISGNTNSSGEKRGVEFKSFEEMQQDFKTGNFSEDELHLLREEADKDGKFYLNFNLDAPLEAAFPASFELELDGIGWTRKGTYIMAYSKENSNISSTVALTSKIAYETLYESKYANPEQEIRSRAIKSFDSVTTEPGRNAAVYSFTTSDNRPVSVVVYTISNGNKVLHCYEVYHLDVSEAVPSSFEILGVQNGSYFQVNMRNLTERPTMDELSVIGLREYVKTEVS